MAWMRVGFIVSVALNLALIGYLAGTGLRGGPPPRLDLGPVGLVGNALPGPERRALRRDLFGSLATFRQTRRSLDAFPTELAEVIRADPFEPEALEALIVRQAASVRAAVDTGMAALARQIATLDADERAALAQRVEAQLSERRRPRN